MINAKENINKQIEKEIENLKNHYFIIVMDLCSSSVILEKLQNAGKIKVWRKFWKGIFRSLTNNSFYSFRCRPYKFVGDGFIILYRHQFADTLFEFMSKLNKEACDSLNKILQDFDIKPKRFGFAYGVDRGALIPMNLLGKHEFIGEAINAATRLQGQLKADEDANSVMVSENVYNSLKLPENVKQIQRNCILHNLYNDNEINCHQIWL